MKEMEQRIAELEKIGLDVKSEVKKLEKIKKEMQEKEA